MSIKVPSKEESQRGFPTLPADEYILQVEEAEDTTQEKYQKPGVTERVLKVKFKVIGLRDGGDLVDDDGEDASGRKLFFTANIESLGYQKDGTPSKSRQFLCHSMKVDIDESIDVESSELEGKKIIGDIIKKANSQGVIVNRIVGFKKLKGDSPTGHYDKQDKIVADIPVIEDDEDIDVKNIPF